MKERVKSRETAGKDRPYTGSNIRETQELAESLAACNLGVSHGVAEPLDPAKAHAT